MTVRLIPFMLLVAATAQAESVRLTNDDLGRRQGVAVPLTADIWAGLQARAYRAPLNYASPPVFDVAPPRHSSGGP